VAIISLPEGLNVTSHKALVDAWWSSLLLIMLSAGQQQRRHSVCQPLGLPFGEKGSTGLTSLGLMSFLSFSLDFIVPSRRVWLGRECGQPAKR